MSLSRAHLSTHREALTVNLDDLAARLEETCPEVVFALVMGSGREGVIAVGSDLDLAVFVDGRASFDLLRRIVAAGEAAAPGVHCDVGVLNRAEPVYRFEALKGRLLFTRDQEQFVSFFSLTCREYESQMADYERQFRFRMEAA
jgi:predicted nucleotidyltransferase